MWQIWVKLAILGGACRTHQLNFPCCNTYRELMRKHWYIQAHTYAAEKSEEHLNESPDLNLCLNHSVLQWSSLFCCYLDLFFSGFPSFFLSVAYGTLTTVKYLGVNYYQRKKRSSVLTWHPENGDIQPPFYMAPCSTSLQPVKAQQ